MDLQLLQLLGAVGKYILMLSQEGYVIDVLLQIPFDSLTFLLGSSRAA